jgi:GT2 family glycosyltransferase
VPSTNPLVSVIIPSYNSHRTIRLCVGSVADQTYRPIETIVVDDGSSDGAAELAESVGATVLRTTVNGGQSTARNLGADHARGEILFFLDSDVALAPGSVAAAVTELRSSPRLGAICGVLGPRSLVSQTAVARYRALQMYHWWLAREGEMDGLHTALCAMRAEVFREIGPFDPGLRHTEAPEYGRRLRQRYEIRSTAAIAGVHDHDATLRKLLPKVFRRARATMLEWHGGEVPSGAGSRVLASGLLLAAVLAVPLPLLVGVAGTVVPPALAAAAVALDAPTYRRVVADHGVRFGLQFTAIHLLYQLTTAAGAGLGSVERMLPGGARRRGEDSVPVSPKGAK